MLSPRTLALSLLVSGCGLASHRAEIRRAPLAPPPEPATRHSAPIWLEIDPGVVPSQCVVPKGQRKLCFEDVHGALASALGQSLWTSFPDAPVRGPGDEPGPGDYRLVVELRLDAVSPSEGGPGWAALGRGRFQLIRGDQTLTGAELESRSRADFPYGRPLGVGAGEVIDAIANHIGTELAKLPETATEPRRELPMVSVTGSIPAATPAGLPAPSPPPSPAPAESLPTPEPAAPDPVAEPFADPLKGPSASGAQLVPYMASASSYVALSSSE